MNVQEMIIEVFEQSADDTELNPYQAGTTTFDITTSGALKCLGYLNRAYKAICTWKDDRGKRVRFHGLHAKTTFQTVIDTGTAQSGTGSSIVLQAASVSIDDYYNGRVIYIDSGTGAGQIRIIMDTTAGTDEVTLNRALDTDLSTDSTYIIMRNFYSLSDMGLTDDELVYGIIKVYDMERKRELTYGSRDSSYVEIMESYQVPTEFIFERNQLIFNYPAKDERWYEVEYFTLPADLNAADDVPAIPEPFHDAIVLYANWLIAKKKGNSDDAALHNRDMRGLINRLVTEDDIMNDRISGNWYVDREVL